MHAMLVDGQPQRLDRLQIAFLEAGIHVTGSGSLAVAECCLRRAVVNILLIDAAACGARLDALVALAERRNPDLATFVLTDQVGPLTDRLSDRIASLHAVLEGDSEPRLVARLARASLSGAMAVRAGTRPPAAPAYGETTRTAVAASPAAAPDDVPGTPQDARPVFQSSRRAAVQAAHPLLPA